MIEYRTYDGDPAQVAEFTQRIWLSMYRGRVTIPLWDEAYFDWQLLAPNKDRSYLVAAYEGRRLVGCLFGEPFRFRLCRTECDGTIGSWLTVDPDRQNTGIGRGLVQEYRRRMLERGSAFLLGFGVPGKASRGTPFWSRLGGESVLPGSVYWWAYTLDPSIVARAESVFHHRWGARLLQLVPQPPASTVSQVEAVRPYRDEDLPACLALLEHAGRSADLSYVWQPGRLAHQLSYRDIPRTLVSVRDGRVAGLVNYYFLGLHGRRPLRAAIIDHFASPGLELSRQSHLMKAAIADIRASGAHVALISQMSGIGRAALLRSGFMPVWPGYRVIFNCIDTSLPYREVRSLQVHLR